MNIKKFYRMKSILDQYHIKPLIGIVPDNKDENLNKGEEIKEFWQEVLKLSKEGWTIGMHGYRHVYDSCERGRVDARHLSEFAGHDYEVQLDRIQAGKEILKEHGLMVDLFFAPGHSFDKSTIKALKEAGFKYISDGRSTWTYRYQEVYFIPCKKYRLDFHPKGIVTNCLHTNNMNEDDFEQIVGYIKRYRNDIIDFSEVMKMDFVYPYITMRCIEIMRVFYERYIRLLLAPYYQKLKHCLRR